MLHLALIYFDKVLQRLLGANANFKEIHFLLKCLRHVSFIYMLCDANIRCKGIIGPSEDIHCVAYRRTEQLRVMYGYKVFTASIIAYGLEPGSIRLQLMDQFSSLNHIAEKTIFEV